MGDVNMFEVVIGAGMIGVGFCSLCVSLALRLHPKTSNKRAAAYGIVGILFGIIGVAGVV
jgi:hypothetical protein